MKKILIMGFTKIKYMPYMYFYLESIDKDRNDIHILYWNRDLQDEDLSEYKSFTIHEFRCYQEDDVSKISKISSFLKYRKFVYKVIQKNKFDLIFVLHSLPGVLLSDVLTRQYQDKFIFDYRDSTYESISIFKKIVGDLVKKSKVTFVSSDGFRKFLPLECESKIFTSHNLLKESLEHRTDKEINGISSDKIRIAFWGFIRHEEINRVIIEKISLDKRFELHYYGREQQVALNLKKYVNDINATNVYFHGEYQPEDRYKFILTTDIIHNIYYDDNTMLAMGNKFYDGVIFRIPQLCMKDSFMGKIVSENNIGLECNPYITDFTDQIYSYWMNLRKETFYNNVENIYRKIVKEYDEGTQYIRSITGVEEG